jgi:hypothetical protein
MHWRELPGMCRWGLLGTAGMGLGLVLAGVPLYFLGSSSSGRYVILAGGAMGAAALGWLMFWRVMISKHIPQPASPDWIDASAYPGRYWAWLLLLALVTLCALVGTIALLAKCVS